MELAILWFIILAFLWTGYLVLEGFDFGVGMLMRVIGKDAKGRRVALNTIGPVWDGNEVWLLTAGGATFAAFPEWYATLFSGFYMPLFLILLALIVRAVAIEYKSKINDESWRNRWEWAIVISSYVPAFLWGVALANILRGVPINEDFTYTGGFFNLLNPFALLGGTVTLLLFLTHGAIFLALKTEGDVCERAETWALRFAPISLVVAAVWAIWAQVSYGEGWLWVIVGIAAAGLAGAWHFSRQRRFGRAFTANAIAIAAAVVLIFGALFPNVMPSSTDPAFSLTVYNASSTAYTLTVMTWVAVVLTPLVLLYQSWTYWVFRRRLSTEDMPEHKELTFFKK